MPCIHFKIYVKGQNNAWVSDIVSMVNSAIVFHLIWKSPIHCIFYTQNFDFSQNLTCSSSHVFGFCTANMKWIQTRCWCSCLLFVIADCICALLLRSMGKILDSAHNQYLSELGVRDLNEEKKESKGEYLDLHS